MHHEEGGEVCRPIRRRSQAPKHRGDLDGPLPGSGAEPGMDILTFLGEDVGL
jgi:hypothetical protein